MGLERVVVNGGCQLRRLGLWGQNSPLACGLEKVIAYLASYLMMLSYDFWQQWWRCNEILYLDWTLTLSELVRTPLAVMFVADKGRYEGDS